VFDAGTCIGDGNCALFHNAEGTCISFGDNCTFESEGYNFTINNDPLFINSEIGNFHLQTINGGYNVNSPSAGSGSNGTDMGAFGGNQGNWVID
jgi:hypothetical protein